MDEGNINNNPYEIFSRIDNKELLNDIMLLEARVEVIFSKMRYVALTENYSSVLNLFDDLNYQLAQYLNKYNYIIQNEEAEKIFNIKYL